MTDDDIEKMKRYFILCLIGFDSPSNLHRTEYLDKLDGLIQDVELLWQRRGEDRSKILRDKLILIRSNLIKYKMIK